MNTNINVRPLHKSRRGVAPVIATLLLVAIAVVGGAIVFSYSQNFFSSSQISGRPTIEAVQIVGYDARALDTIQDHNGNLFTTDTTDNGDAVKDQGERVTVYIKNDSVQPITLSELRFGGSTYEFRSGQTNPPIADTDALTAGLYTIASASGGSDLLAPIATPSVQPGQTASIVLSVSEDMKSGRDTQFKMTTTNGAVFVGTVVIGQQSG